MFGVSFGNAKMERLSFFFAVVLGSAVQAQNLVPNGSFEQYSECPQTVGLAQFATGWSNLFTNSADYYNTCTDNAWIDIPQNSCGFQFAVDGQAYMGMYTHAIGGIYREMVGVDLLEPLQPGVPVCLSFEMAVGGFGTWSGNSPALTCRGVGIKFFAILPEDWETYLYPNSAALYMEEVSFDTANWYHVSGIYVPDSAYTHLVMANFFSNELSSPELLDSTGYGVPDVAYAFIDDVRASFELSYCDGENQIEEAVLNQPIVYPNPVIDLLNVSSPGRRRPAQISIHDSSGRSVYQGMSNEVGESYTVDVSDLLPGIYVLCMSDASGSFAPVRFVHVAP